MQVSSRGGPPRTRPVLRGEPARAKGWGRGPWLVTAAGAASGPAGSAGPASPAESPGEAEGGARFHPPFWGWRRLSCGGLVTELGGLVL